MKRKKQENTSKGFIYVLSNPAFDGLLKIGFTTRSVKQRAKELYGTGVPDPFKIEYSKKLANAYKIEQQVHICLRKYRHKRNREFFKCDLKTAINTINMVSKQRVELLADYSNLVIVLLFIITFTITLWLTLLS
ncbi:MAG TPA: GIY-YIG nuclease family protein [Thiothrix sp.]|nr:GIY-YIG nuclease family protein [Thiothrix sp.]